MSDTVGDFIIRLKNAGAVHKESVLVPYSKFKMAIAEKLKDAGYIKAAEKKGKKVKKNIEVTLFYEKNGDHKIHNVKRISKPGRRMYKNAGELHPIRFGNGSLILSTPKGVLTEKEAQAAGVGGEALFEIW